MNLFVVFIFLVGLSTQDKVPDRLGININTGVQAENISHSNINIIVINNNNEEELKNKCVATWFEAKHEEGLRYHEMKKRCKAAARDFEETVGYPAFFRNKEEYNQYRNTVGNRQEYLGYEQRYGDNNHWVNADNSEITFTDWDLDYKSGFTAISPQPDNDSEDCAITGWNGHRQWHDGPCENPINALFSCRFEQESDDCNRPRTTTSHQIQDTEKSFLVGDSPKWPARETLLGHVTGSLEFEVSIDIQCTHRQRKGQWNNIFHMTTGGDHSEFGNRLFGIWEVPSSTGVLHVSTYNIDKNAYQTTIDLPPCTNGEWNTYRLMQTPLYYDGRFMAVYVKKDEKLILESHVPVNNVLDRIVNKRIAVYLGDPWYAPANEYRVKNFIYSQVNTD